MEEAPDEVAGDAVEGELGVGVLEGGVVSGFEKGLGEGVFSLTLLLQQAGVGIGRAGDVFVGDYALTGIAGAGGGDKVIVGVAEKIDQADGGRGG